MDEADVTTRKAFIVDTCRADRCPLPLFIQKSVTYPNWNCTHREGAACRLQMEMKVARDKLERAFKNKR